PRRIFSGKEAINGKVKHFEVEPSSAAKNARGRTSQCDWTRTVPAPFGAGLHALGGRVLRRGSADRRTYSRTRPQGGCGEGRRACDRGSRGYEAAARPAASGPRDGQACKSSQLGSADACAGDSASGRAVRVHGDLLGAGPRAAVGPG